LLLQKVWDWLHKVRDVMWNVFTECVKNWVECYHHVEEYILLPLVIVGLIAVLIYAFVVIAAAGMVLEIIVGAIFVGIGVAILGWLLYLVVKRIIEGIKRLFRPEPPPCKSVAC
jgi:uncharacterized oligopeptide transporter (OPT) family protein